jgi:hypothetical protein
MGGWTNTVQPSKDFVAADTLAARLTGFRAKTQFLLNRIREVMQSSKSE